ncbi:MAG: hypothetical protein MR616_08605, partial [Pyramidobacter sp.]|nr:hypothetical protein [Pyramidobacter sp.]
AAPAPTPRSSPAAPRSSPPPVSKPQTGGIKRSNGKGTAINKLIAVPFPLRRFHIFPDFSKETEAKLKQHQE